MDIRCKLIKRLAGSRPIMLNMRVINGKHWAVVGATKGDDANVTPRYKTKGGFVHRCLIRDDGDKHERGNTHNERGNLLNMTFLECFSVCATRAEEGSET